MNSVNFEFLDCGEGLRLERISDKTFIRQSPQADYPRSLSEIWMNPDYEYRVNGTQSAWYSRTSEEDVLPDFIFGNMIMELRLSENGQLGVYPEQQDNWNWLSGVLESRQTPLRILNGFAYTGGSTIICAQALRDTAGSEICHLDASRSAVNWAKINRDKSGLPENSIRFIVDDIIKFLEREVRRGRVYDGLILDPPAFGRAPGGKTWRLKRDLPELMTLCSKVLSPNPQFFLLSCHDPELNRRDLSSLMAAALGKRTEEIETLDLVLKSKNGNSLPNGIAARWSSLFGSKKK